MGKTSQGSATFLHSEMEEKGERKREGEGSQGQSGDGEGIRVTLVGNEIGRFSPMAFLKLRKLSV